MAGRRRSPASFTLPGITRRRRRRTLLTMILGLITAIIIIAADHAGYLKSHDKLPPPTEFNQQTFLVTHVIDGDTVIIVPPGGGGETSLRLLGIDSPEMNFHTDLKPDYWAQQSTDWMRAHVEGKQVLVRTNPPRERDRYGRLLAYIYLDPSHNLSLDSLAAGQSYTDRRFSHPMKKEFELAESQAEKNHIGLWQNVKVSQMPDWRQRWLDEQK